MKKLSLIVLFLAAVYSSKAQTNVDDAKAIQMLKEFYTGYMTAIATSTPKNFSENRKKWELLKKEYCTAKLLNNIPKLAEQDDCDPLIAAQDSREDCVKNLTFTKNNKKPNAYTISYFYLDDFSKKKETCTINLTVIKQNEKYKIDSIWR